VVRKVADLQAVTQAFKSFQAIKNNHLSPPDVDTGPSTRVAPKAGGFTVRVLELVQFVPPRTGIESKSTPGLASAQSDSTQNMSTEPRVNLPSIPHGAAGLPDSEQDRHGWMGLTHKSMASRYLALQSQQSAESKKECELDALKRSSNSLVETVREEARRGPPKWVGIHWQDVALSDMEQGIVDLRRLVASQEAQPSLENPFQFMELKRKLQHYEDALPAAQYEERRLWDFFRDSMLAGLVAHGIELTDIVAVPVKHNRHSRYGGAVRPVAASVQRTEDPRPQANMISKVANDFQHQPVTPAKQRCEQRDTPGNQMSRSIVSQPLADEQMRSAQPLDVGPLAPLKRKIALLNSELLILELEMEKLESTTRSSHSDHPALFTLRNRLVEVKHELAIAVAQLETGVS